MKLTESQLSTLSEQGFLVLHDRFGEDDVDVIRQQLPALFAEDNPANIIEQGSNEVRTSMGLHLRNPVFANLIRDPRLVEPASQILNEAFYTQQVKVNVKAAFSGEVWQWHYDFATHHEEDSVEKPLALNLHILLDDVTEFNGPLYFIPGSHKAGPHGAWLDNASTSYPLWIVDNDKVRALVEQNGIVSATGKRGTMLIFHDTLVHGSPNNMSPWDRAIFSLIVNPVSNRPTSPNRPDYKHHRDFTPIEMLKKPSL